MTDEPKPIRWPRKVSDDLWKRRIYRALAQMVYETTHLSAEEPDGSHWCKISREALEEARAALRILIEGNT
jgi:hypothetical protein